MRQYLKDFLIDSPRAIVFLVLFDLLACVGLFFGVMAQSPQVVAASIGVIVGAAVTCGAMAIYDSVKGN